MNDDAQIIQSFITVLETFLFSALSRLSLGSIQ